MTSKQVDNDQWFVKDLISKINDKNINKPKFQRKKIIFYSFLMLKIVFTRLPLDNL
jgi:hypothetical protein